MNFYDVLERAIKNAGITELYYNRCMKARNSCLVELSDCCFCYWDGRYRSGTAQAVKLAQKKKIMIVNSYRQ